ncbi:hypothetical protein EXN66_Car010055 [Channa argus]|uniref:Uncharacterized protein n=1 Tax=Channa argus TaxID=215402 RepID=A0A6G1PVW8_CHAAH|nr:hypothetical protein EXN66_Car010055 [Channa argus]
MSKFTFKHMQTNIPLEQALGDSGEEKLPFKNKKEETSSRTRLKVDGHLP